jgi:hypothetical protein
MRICKLDLASTIYGSGGGSGDFGLSALSFSFNPTPVPAAAAHPTAFAAISLTPSPNVASFGSFFSTDSGVTNGKRDDGQPLGYGCGDAKTDARVPDHLFGHDLTDACRAHDKNYETCGVTKEAADSQLGHDVSVAMGGGVLGAVVGGAYQLGVALGGQSAYNQAQTDSGCRASAGDGSSNSASSDSSHNATDARGGYGSYGGGDGGGGD